MAQASAAEWAHQAQDLGIYADLGNWVGTQRGNTTSVTKERIGKLNALGFIWDSYGEA